MLRAAELLLCLAVACTSVASHDALAQEGLVPPLTRHVLIVGDSEACAVKPYASAIAMQHSPADIVAVECKVGTRVDYWGTGGHLAEALAAHPDTDTVVVFLGTNHYADRAAPNVKPILDQVKAHSLGCEWVGNTAVRGRSWPINGLLRSAVVPTCVYFDTEAAHIPLADGVHPTVAGAVTWLKLIWPTIPQKREKTP